MKLVRETLYEELIGQVPAPVSNWGRSRVKPKDDVYKNPPTIKRLDSWVRAITDLNGNLYVMDGDNYIHNDLIKFLIDQGEIPHKDEDDDDYFGYYDNQCYIDIVAWQRLGKTNKFYLAESYSRYKDDFELNLKTIKKIFNYSGSAKIEFIFERIDFSNPEGRNIK